MKKDLADVKTTVTTELAEVNKEISRISRLVQFNGDALGCKKLDAAQPLP